MKKIVLSMLLFSLVSMSSAMQKHKDPWKRFRVVTGLSLLAATAYSFWSDTSSNILNKEYIANKKIMLNSGEPIFLHKYRTAIDNTQDIFNFELSKDHNSAAKNFEDEIGSARVRCKKATCEIPSKCTLELLYINEKFRQLGYGSMLLNETLLHLKRYTYAEELNLIAHSSTVPKEKLYSFYQKHGGKKSEQDWSNKFAFNLRDNKI